MKKYSKQKSKSKGAKKKKISRNYLEKSGVEAVSGGDLFVLPQVVDITYAQMFHKEMTKALSKNTEIVIDAAVVERITTPCVQIILAAAKALSGKKVTLKIQKPSQNFEEAFFILGLRKQLEEWRAS